MPLDGDRGFNGDMPAIWALNGRIPRTMQYGACSCWLTGCGEADFFEVLRSGDTKCKSTIHVKDGAGSSDYFERPTHEFVKFAVVFDEATASIAIKKLPYHTDFSTVLNHETVQGWIKGTSDKNNGLSSLFQMS